MANKYLDLDGLTLFKSKTDELYETKTEAAGKIDNPAQKSSGQVLTYNGTTWVASTPAETGVTSVTTTSGEKAINVDNTTPATPKLSLNLTATQGVVTLSQVNDGLKADVADSALTIAKTNGLQTALDGKQATLTAGAGIAISAQNVISATTGLNIHICQTGEYDPTTRIPTIQNPNPTTIYLVPKSTSASGNAYDEWIYTNNAWEKIGSTEISIESISNAEILALFA